MLIYVTHSTKFSHGEAQGILHRAEQTPPTPKQIKLGCGYHAERQAVVIWDHTHCWVLRPEEARAWGNQPPTHTGSRYQGYKLKQKKRLTFNPHPAWFTTLPVKISITLHAQAEAYRQHILKERARAKAYRLKKKTLAH
jgi:hypothetical protein